MGNRYKRIFYGFVIKNKSTNKLVFSPTQTSNREYWGCVINIFKNNSAKLEFVSPNYAHSSSLLYIGGLISVGQELDNISGSLEPNYNAPVDSAIRLENLYKALTIYNATKLPNDITLPPEMLLHVNDENTTTSQNVSADIAKLYFSAKHENQPEISLIK